MAGVLDHDSARVVIKREIEDSPESPEHTEVQDSPQSQPETNGSQKHSKAFSSFLLSDGLMCLTQESVLLQNISVWSEDETRSMIELHKNYVQRFKDGNYSKRQLLEDVAQELNLIGYDATPEKVRNKMKYLRSRYKGLLEYNAKHVEKKIMPFQEELTELYKMDYYNDQEPLFTSEINGNGSSDISFHANNSERLSKRTKSIPASHVDLRTVVTTKKKNNTVSKAKVLKKKAQSKRAQPLYQCGLCMSKFRTSNHMHDHACKAALKMNNLNSSKKKASQNSGTYVFHWNSLITMQFLDLLKEYQDSHKNSNFRKGNLWENLSALMKRLGHKIHPKILSKKWHILRTSFEKTVTYNESHKDKKKCAFFKRLLELYNHPSSFDCFNHKNEPTKRTVEVSPFSFSRAPTVSPSKMSSPNCSNTKFIKEEKGRQSSMSEIMSWLNNTWTEYKEMEKSRRELESQRHNEIMEMLSYLIDSRDKH